MQVCVSEEEQQSKDGDKGPEKEPAESGAAARATMTLPVKGLRVARARGFAIVMFNDDLSSNQLRVVADEF